MSAPHPLFDKILVEQAALESTDLVPAALREITPAVEEWVGRNIQLICDEHGWLIRYTSGNGYPSRLMDRYGERFQWAEDAIQALAELAAKNKAEFERTPDPRQASHDALPESARAIPPAAACTPGRSPLRPNPPEHPQAPAGPGGQIDG